METSSTNGATRARDDERSMATAAPAVRQVKARTREIRKVRSRVERVCEELDSYLTDDLRRGDDFWLSRGSCLRRRPYARAVWVRLERSHPRVAEAARLVSVACEMARRCGAYAKKQVKAAEVAMEALWQERAAERAAARTSQAARERTEER